MLARAVGAAVYRRIRATPDVFAHPAVDITAAKVSDGATYVGLVNIDPDESAQVQLTLGHARGRVSGQVLTAGAMDSQNRFGVPEDVRPRPFAGVRRQAGGLQVDMPARSIVVLKIEP